MLEVSSLLHLVASEIGPEHSLDYVADTVSVRLGRRISADAVAYLIDTKLRPLGLIADACGPPVLAPPRPAMMSLTLRAGVIPSRVVRSLTTVLRPLFLPPVVLSALLALAALDAWLVLDRGVGHLLRHVLDRPSSVVVVVILTLAAGGFHELGHATASRYGGAQPGRIGVGIYLLWPVFYNDLNDSYQLSRRGRLRADLGGVYFNVVLMLILAAVYAGTGLELLLVVVVLQHLAVVQQFLPFVRLDGYYMVSDLAGVPDLFGRIRPVLSSLLPWRSPTKAVTELRPGPRAVVTIWVLCSVPLLATCVVLSVVHMPGLLTALWQSLNVQSRVLAAALRQGAFPEAFLSAVQMLFLLVPIAGVTITLLRAVRRRRSRPRRPAPSPSPLLQPAERLTADRAGMASLRRSYWWYPRPW